MAILKFQFQVHHSISLWVRIASYCHFSQGCSETKELASFKNPAASWANSVVKNTLCQLLPSLSGQLPCGELSEEVNLDSDPKCLSLVAFSKTKNIPTAKELRDEVVMFAVQPLVPWGSQHFLQDDNSGYFSFQWTWDTGFDSHSCEQSGRLDTTFPSVAWGQRWQIPCLMLQSHSCPPG